MTWTLLGFGSLDWDAHRRVIGEATCTWADYAGFQRGTCPSSAPPYSHLWGWNSDGRSLFRIRVDGGRGILGVLTSEPEKYTTMITSVPVEVEERVGIPWGDDGQIRLQPPHVLLGNFRLYEVLRPMPVTFVFVSNS